MASALTLIRGAFAYMDGIIDPPSSMRHLTTDTLGEGGEVWAIGDPMAACVILKPKSDMLQIGKLAVRDDMRRRGLAAALAAQAEARAGELGLEALELQSRVELTDNHRAFERLGFVKTGETAHPGYDRATSITMRKTLTGHLRYARADADGRRRAFDRIVLADPLTAGALQDLRRLDLPQGAVVSGALYNTVWNALTGRPSGHGVKDVDVFYWDPDTSYEAEDRVIRDAAKVLGPRTPPIEIRNQARVHHWYQARFGHPRAPIPSTKAGIDDFASLTHCVGAWLDDDDRLQVYAPYGLGRIFEFRLSPNPSLNNSKTYQDKARRALECWPELTVEPWPEAAA